MALALPKLRWLVLGAIVAGVWITREDMKDPRPPQPVPTWIERIVGTKPPPSKPAATAKADKPVPKPTTRAAVERPVPPRPVTGKPVPKKTIAAKTSTAALQEPALVLPKTVARPPARPPHVVTGSISRPDRPTFVQTKAKVHLRAQARPDAPIIATLQPRTLMRELARSGEWRLLMGDGRKGWVRADYVGRESFLPRRPRLPVAETSRAKASGKSAEAR